MELQDIVRRLRMKQSIKAIKRETGKHRRVIRRVLELAGQEGWLDAAGRGARAAIGAPTPGGISRAARRRRWPVPPALDARRDQIEGWRGDGYSFLVIQDHGTALHPSPLPATGATSNAPRDQARRSDGSGLRASGAHLGCRHAFAAAHLGVLRPAAPLSPGLSRGGLRSKAGDLLRLSHARLRVLRRR